MSDTAVGLFANAGSAEAAVEALKKLDFPSTGIRTLAAPGSFSVNSSTSTPMIDFEAALTHDLSSMGATEGECESYVAGLRHGNVLVFATGTADQAITAIDLMSRHDAIEVEELVGAVPSLPGVTQGFAGAHSISAKEDRIRARTTGAKIFSW